VGRATDLKSVGWVFALDEQAPKLLDTSTVIGNRQLVNFRTKSPSVTECDRARTAVAEFNSSRDVEGSGKRPIEEDRPHCRGESH